MKIALLGYGVEGQSAFRYYSYHFPDARFDIYDNAEEPKYAVPEGATFIGGVKDFHNIKADIVIRTPAIAPSKISSLGKITSVTREFFETCQAPIIGVTGTKGKGTTASLIAAILKAAGKKVWLIGNIGKPALDVLDKVQDGDIVVYELSSFQLWDLNKSPHVAVVLMIEPEHLDVHTDFDEYVQAKSNITRYQTDKDKVVYFAKNEVSKQIAEQSLGQKIPYDIPPSDDIVVDGEIILKKNEVGLRGEHNLENIYAALLATKEFSPNVDAIKEALISFKGLPHRLEEVRIKDDVLFVDDSFSSAPPSLKAAISAFDQPTILIAGGYDRGLDYSDMAESIIKKGTVKKVLLMGQTKDAIAEKLSQTDYKDFELFDSLESAVERAKSISEPGDIVLLSPGCASFDMFKNFSERGDRFKELVNTL